MIETKRLLLRPFVKTDYEDVFAKYRQKAREIWQDGKPKKWYYAIPIIVIWFFCFSDDY